MERSWSQRITPGKSITAYWLFESASEARAKETAQRNEGP
jgi:hypothetical protein